MHGNKLHYTSILISISNQMAILITTKSIILVLQTGI